jgi:hypothetical protein
VPEDNDEVFAALAAGMGAPPLTPEEVTAVLRLAKAVADASERRFAPLTCYAAGLVIGADASDTERLARLRQLIDEVRPALGDV